MKYLIDTCVLSETFKPKPSKKVLEWLDACPEDLVYLSVLTLGELQKGISRMPDSNRKQIMQRWLDVDLKNRFALRLLDVDYDTVSLWGRMLAESEKKGLSIPAIDSLIGATALAHGLVVVTRNVKDIEKCGVTCINPF